MRRWANLWRASASDRSNIFSARMSGHRAGKGDVFPVWDILPFPKSLMNDPGHRRKIELNAQRAGGDYVGPAMAR